MLRKRTLSAVFVVAAALALTLCATSTAFAAVSPGDVCAVLVDGTTANDEGYATFDDALGNVGDGGTIYLLADATYGGPGDFTPPNYGATSLTFDLRGYDLSMGMYGISLDGSSLTILNGGTVSAFDIDLIFGGSLVADANFNLDDALWVQHDSTVTITGNIQAVDYGAEVDTGGVLYLTGNVTVDDGTGVAVEDGGTATVEGNIDAYYALFVYGSSLTVTGDVKSEIYCLSENNSTLILDGDLTVSGDATPGILATDSSTATVNGNITMTGSGSFGAGVGDDGQVTVKGVITAPNYVVFGSLDYYDDFIPTTIKTPGQNDPTSLLSGFNQYSFANGTATAYVWVLPLSNTEGTSGGLPSGTAADLIPGTGDGTPAAGLAALVAAALSGIALVLLKRLRSSQR